MSSPETDRFIRNWNRIHKQTSRTMRAAHGADLNWRPKEGMFSLRDLIRHIPEAELALVGCVLGDSTQKLELEVADCDASEIADGFDRFHEDLAAEVAKLTADQLNQEVEFHGKKIRRKILLAGMTEHEIHHRGQLFTYYRLCGIEPPNLYD